VLKRNR